ncbi:hypothetical protein ABZY81_39185 [Streptomyces sp. NPDC006514]|uniref:hypothetical protein n=1 Tax=Streptomyces sp. NPDC006514 TaxID=3154308 RepID=UPI0033B17636
MREAAQGHSRPLVLVGSSSTGKTRACWESVQPLAKNGWCLWHPFAPTRAQAALDGIEKVEPRTVVWLNEAQHYLDLDAPGTCEALAAALHTLLTDSERGPVLILGTLWPESAESYALPPTPGGPDPYSRVRELLAGRLVGVPESFDGAALRSASVLAAGRPTAGRCPHQNEWRRVRA